MIEASPFAIVATDLIGNVKSWNAAAERIFGWAADEVIDQLPPFITGTQREEYREKIELAGRGELIAGLERKRRCKNGSSVDVAIWAAPLRDAAGSVAGIVMAIADISERKKLEEQLRHSQKMESIGQLFRI